jgi:hypothetical protein
MLKLEKGIIIQKLIIKRILNKNKKYPRTDLFENFDAMNIQINI